MAKRLLGALTAVAVVLFAGQFAFADNVTAEIPFQFRAGKQVLPAGTYVITFEKTNPKTLTLRAQGGGAATTLPIITQLAMHEATDGEAHVIFDKVDDEHTLAEVWPAKADGYYVGGAFVSHTHVVINAK